ncbi:DUF262 domain-containing protein [Phycisphaerales bacterium AB-hyl4]|uniref:DUF262 domain-containing protein n=1 Tax=Natronomicrosphaera hydrolytica TaxID=3242702 RepID=A0ABV4U9I2_9BACT
MGSRRQNFQNISWFWDQKQRERLDLNPPYQRRSVWGERYRQDFIDTILLDFPAPVIFLHSRIDQSGISTYEVVDGKQRLTAIFDFLEDRLAVGDRSPRPDLRGKYFSDLDPETRMRVYEYDFSVEYLPTDNEEVVNNIFDRLNRNVAKLTPQELRHAQFDGPFLRTAERLADWMIPDFEGRFPRITLTSRRQMKDVEFVASLLLLLEEGPRSYSVAAMDKAFADRDEQWEEAIQTEEDFREAIHYLRALTRDKTGEYLRRCRFRNQADFYSLFGAVVELRRQDRLPPVALAAKRLRDFHALLENRETRESLSAARAYLEAARTASNDAKPRSTRIDIMSRVLQGENLPDGGEGP